MRHEVPLWAFAVLVALTFLPTVSVAMSNREVSIEVHVVDPSGHPVPYVTVWGGQRSGAGH